MLSDIIANVGAECGYEVVTSNIVSSDDVTTQMLLGMCNRVVKEMADAYCWPKLRKSASFTLVSSQATYELPGDFSYYHYETFWNSSDQWKLYGPLSQQAYAERLGYGNLATVYDEFQIRGMTDSEITITSTPGTDTAGNIIIYEYTSARPVRPRTWEEGLTVTSGSYIFYNGNYYTAGAAGTTGATPPTHTTGSASDDNITWTYYSGAYQKFLADTDVCNLNERILEQGVMERFGVIKELAIEKRYDYQLENEYGKIVQGKKLHAGGRSRTRFQHASNGVVRFGS